MNSPVYTCIAIDDHKLSLMKFESFLAEIPKLDLIGSYTNPVQGATAVIKEMPDFLFVDLEMPYMDGYSLLEWILPRLKELHKKPKIVVISGNEAIMDHEHEDVVTHIRKDRLITPEDLKAALVDILN